jgi:alkanesulfonate monooxygenase SsuD/methylene tetrahydromethanopterin reductase-like flavin-dependent oxidoreductase (luciferase family)
MKLGLVLPSFSLDAEAALGLADAAARAGIDGVFAYDHLWPMKDRTRPALAPFPLLGAIASEHHSLVVGPLVARIGLVADELLVAQLRALTAISPGRVIAAMGTGDKLSAEENLAYGVDFAPAAERRASLEWCATELGREGIEVWIGGGAAPTIELAERLGVAINLWQAAPEKVAEFAARGPVTWAGTLPEDNAVARVLLRDIERAGASWAVAGGIANPEHLLDIVRG